MTSSLRHKIAAAAGVALFFGTQLGMGFRGRRDLFPLFTWSLYSYASTNIETIPQIEITAIDGRKAAPDVLRAYRGTVAFAQRDKLAQAVRRNDRDRARSVLRDMLRGAGVPFEREVELIVHWDDVRLTDYLRSGDVVSRKSLPTKIERL